MSETDTLTIEDLERLERLFSRVANMVEDGLLRTRGTSPARRDAERAARWIYEAVDSLRAELCERKQAANVETVNGEGYAGQERAD